MIFLLWLAGAIQLGILSLNFVLPKELGYWENAQRLSPFFRQVFLVHHGYILLVLLGAAGLCFFFPSELAGGSALGRALSGFLAVFWGSRTAIQLFYYDKEVRRRYRAFDVPFAMSLVYLAAVFAAAALGLGGGAPPALHA